MSGTPELTPERMASVQAVMQKLVATLEGVDHAEALDALMQLYHNLALHYPCCTFGCAVQAGKVAAQLMVKAHAIPQAHDHPQIH